MIQYQRTDQFVKMACIDRLDVAVLVALLDGFLADVVAYEALLAFGVAAGMAFRKASQKAAPVLLEPVMDVEIVLPEEYLGDVINDLNSKRARILGMHNRENGIQVVEAHVPLAELFGYSTDLRSVTQGRANFTMQFYMYEEVPAKRAEKIIKKVKGLV